MEPVEDITSPRQQKVIEEFQKLVTQDTLEQVKEEAVRGVQHSVIVPSPSESFQMGRTMGSEPPREHPVNGPCRDRYVLNGTYFPSGPTHPIPSQNIITNVSKPYPHQDQRKELIMHAKIQPASNSNEVLKSYLKEERNALFDNNLGGEDCRAFKELLAEKDSIDFNSFMNEYTEEGPPLLDPRRKMFLSPPPSPSLPEDSCLLPKYLEESLIKLEPDSNPSSPMDSSGLPPDQYSPPQYEVTQQQVPEQQAFPHLHARARAIYLRAQSQDSLTRTKNPVLPSIHAESSLVPDVKLAKYPVINQETFSLDFSEEREGGLTDLRGQLFLAEELGQNIFQPWN